VALLKGLFAGFQVLDSYGVDGAVNGVADTAIATGRAVRRAETGQLQLYGLFMGIGIVAIVLALYFFG
jgi:NADH-quinone oxidoreductase subunit L